MAVIADCAAVNEIAHCMPCHPDQGDRYDPCPD